MDFISGLFYGSVSCFGRNKSRLGVFVCLLSIVSFPVLFLGACRGTEAKQNTTPEGESNTKVKDYHELVRPQEDGSLLLHAEYGRAIGSEIKYMPEWQAYGWFTSSSSVEWEVEVGKSGAYEVYLEWSVSDEEAGKPFAFITEDQRLTGEVGRTGAWENYEIEKVGEIQLSSGRQKMVLKPASEFEEGGALLDLRGIYLIPQKVVRPLPDGSLLLHAEYGRAFGPEIQYMPEWQAYGWFTSSSSSVEWDVSGRVEWDVEVEESGAYEVYLEWSVSDESAGKPFVFVTEDQRLTGEVGRTGGWADYEIEKVGQIHLSSGKQKMGFMPDPEFEEGGALLDLRGVYLIPAE